MSRLNNEIKQGLKDLTLSIGIVETGPQVYVDPEGLIGLADKKMYATKRVFKEKGGASNGLKSTGLFPILSQDQSGVSCSGCICSRNVLLEIEKHIRTPRPYWWSWGGLNPLPPDCEPGALPIELQPHKFSWMALQKKPKR